jgi:hypothetical protein
VCYAEPLGVNHCDLYGVSGGCASWCVMLTQGLTIIVYYTVPVVVNNCELC